MKTYLLRLLTLLLAVALIASACGGESSDSDDVAADTSTPAATQAPAGGDDDDPEPEEPAAEEEESVANYYDDPRDGIFDEFQQTYDRGDHPFTQVDTICLAHDPAPNRVDTDPGITADTVAVGHIRTRLEDAAQLGFAVPVGDPEEMFEVFADYINEECGGIRGRMIDLGYAEADILGNAVDESRNQACLALTEDHDSVIVMNSSGFQGSANLCIVEEQRTAFISTQGQAQEFMTRGEDRLVSLGFTREEDLKFLALDLIQSGVLEGKTVGVVAANTPGQAEAVEEGVVNTLREAGFDPVFDVLDCQGATVCTGGLPQSVTNMVQAGVDALFTDTNIFTTPNYVAEMVNQGYEPGDVQFYAADVAELTAGQIANNVEAGNLYDGARLINFRATGEYRTPNYEPNPFIAECNRVYAENSPSGASHSWQDLGDSAYGMTGTVCAIMRIMARAIYDAGDNPTIADVHEALANLGPIDNNALLPASIRPGKTQSADAIQTLEFSFPCTQPLPYARPQGDPICITGLNDWRFAPR